MPSIIRSPASDPWKTVFGSVFPLSSVSVMRIGITVPVGRVTVLTTGGGGGGGGGGATTCTGSWAGRGGGGGGGGGAASAISLCRFGTGAAFAALAGATTRLLTTVRTPSTVALSAAARAREALLSTFPSRVATPLATLT